MSARPGPSGGCQVTGIPTGIDRYSEGLENRHTPEPCIRVAVTAETVLPRDRFRPSPTELVRSSTGDFKGTYCH